MSGNRYTTHGSSREYMASESDHHVSAIKRVWHYSIAIMHGIVMVLISMYDFDYILMRH